jgi:hypothetical protein
MINNAVKDNNGNVVCSIELWEQIAEIIKNVPIMPDINNMAKKIATALVKADVDCIKICGNFGGGCYWKCEEKVEHIKQWIIEVINNG